MIDLAYTKTELADEKAEIAAPEPSGYPYGLSIRMESETLDKLGLMNPLPQVGGEITMTVVAYVTGVNKSVGMQDPETCVAMQITQAQIISVEQADKEVAETPASETQEAKRPMSLMAKY